MGINEEAYRFCPLCGKEIERPGPDNLESIRVSCIGCGFIQYSDPKLVVCAVLEIDQRILLVKRAYPPQTGTWVLPGGYADRGEELRAAAARETEEECGLRIRVKDLIGLYSYTGNPIVLVVYQAGYVSGELRINNENLDVEWFGHEEIPWDDIGFQSTRDALKDFIKKKRV